jgi:diaminohydroxyphosphoribosylaminopyrimidine deaminase/5-amino-6-(5-phosphoribosylamino)uracil reductase
MSFSAYDYRFMAQAITLAERGRYTTRPNPRVGCVLVKDNQIIAEGWHYRAGEGHAEVQALSQLANSPESSVGATAYVTLEPCSHQGKTGACVSALIAAGVVKVVYGMEDPNPLVSGQGLSILRNAGVQVDGPLLKEQVQQLNVGFAKRMTQKLPWVRCKIAASLDGRTAMASGESQWITSSAARGDVQKLRAQSCAVVTGIGSVLQDDSRLTLREETLALDNVGDVLALPPIRVVLDSALRIDPQAAIFANLGMVIVFTAHDASAAKEAVLLNAGIANVVVERIDSSATGLNLQQVLQCLAGRYQCNEVLLEAGAILSGAFLQAGLIDELFIYQAPILLGNEARGLMALPLQSMTEKVELTIKDRRMVGDDLRTHALLNNTAIRK